MVVRGSGICWDRECSHGDMIEVVPFTVSVPQAVSPDCLNLSDLLAVVQLSLQADLSVRLDICRQVREKVWEIKGWLLHPGAPFACLGWGTFVVPRCG